MKEQKTGLSIPYPRGRFLRKHADAGQAPAARLEKWLLRRFLASVHGPPVDIQLWDGTLFSSSGKDEGARNTVVFKDRGALWRMISNSALNFGDDYSAGRIEVEGNLVEFLETVFRANPTLPQGSGVRRAVRRSGVSNGIGRAKKNIHHHYDIGNDFYKLWLDGELVYTCAYFPQPSASLEEAQAAKMDHVCRKLRLRPGESVVEAGCGWGGLSRHMAKHYGVKVKAFNISHEQIAECRARADAEGLNDRIEYVEDDYRNITGKFDAFVSIGMLEHVGLANYRELGRVIDNCLEENGRGLIHSIGKNSPSPMNEWIDKRIFPGAYPPTLSQMMGILEPFRFSVVDVENLRLHYARTLEHWLKRFEQNVGKVRAMYDDTFVRAWRLYLSSSIASFSTGGLQLFQVLFHRYSDNDVPWTRDALYCHAGEEGGQAHG